MNVSSLPKPQKITGHRLVKERVQYSLEGQLDPKGEIVWFPSWNLRVAAPVSTGGAQQAARPSAVRKGHVLTTDAQVPESERTSKKTPGGLRMEFQEERLRIWKSNPPKVSDPQYSARNDYSKFAQIVTEPPVVTETGITLHCQILCNPEHMATPHDLVPVTLEIQDNTVLDRITLLEPGKGTNGNVCDVEVAYTYEQLAQLLKATPPSGSSGAALRDWFIAEYPQLGVKAEWLTAQTEGGTNAPNHFSGGIKGKGGSGKVKLRPLTESELKAAERVRLSDWNAGERLRSDRAVYVKYADVLRPGEEMATGIEAEAEYDVGKDAHAGALAAMARLLGDQDARADMGILEMKRLDDKITTDTYYDTAAKDLLSRGIGLRRRHCEGDAPGTFLFSVKGRSAEFEHERFRLSAQTQLLLNPASESEGPRVWALCRDTMTDNPFARIVDDALTRSTRPTSWGESWRLEVALTVSSTRIKYSIELRNGTTVEFSADTATATSGQRSSTRYCVELGVGHPGLVATDSAGSGTSTGTMMRYTRPYHVPDDLDNPAFVRKSDFQQFAALRSLLVPYLFGRKPDELTLGGNKAITLAHDLGLLT
ncbi:hypothetical protein [Streptomyces sp. NPDC096142]|uniref:hypothetical protein n=1 Tax=Streptomyces sp. NPDC096142 TaxID=3366077 RepID=UPI0038264DFA